MEENKKKILEIIEQIENPLIIKKILSYLTGIIEKDRD